MTKVTLQVEGMHCKSCEVVLKEALEEVPGIAAVSVSQKDNKAVFSADTPEAVTAAKQVIVKEGYKVK